ncbi:MAG: hypothetical protein IJV00_02780, partial [Clostridia bacterium]|nr:hypothetical protein [Clostridia bacterium]
MTDRRNWKTGFSVGLVGEEYLKKAAEAGIDVVEIFGVDGPNEIWEKLPLWQEQTGVKIWSLHLPFGGPELCDVATWDPFWWSDSLRRYKRKILPAAAVGRAVQACCALHDIRTQRNDDD